jgi:hypothetical protein
MIQQKHTIYLGGVTVSVTLKNSEDSGLFNRVVKKLNNISDKSTERQSEIDVLNLPTGKPCSWADIVDNELDKKKTVPSETPKRASKKTVPSETPKRASKNTQQRKARRAKQRKAEMDAKIADAIAEKKAEMKAEMEAARAEMEDDFKEVSHRKTRKGGHKHAHNQCAFGRCCRNEECGRVHPLSDKWDKSTCIYGVYCRYWQQWWHSRDPTDMCPYDHSYHRRFKGFVPQS